MLADGTSTAYLVYGGVWSSYRADASNNGCHGYPTSSLTPLKQTSPGQDNTAIQTFQHGSITWDATTNSVTQDAC